LERTIKTRRKRPKRTKNRRMAKETKIPNFLKRKSLKRKNKLRPKKETNYNKCSSRKTAIQGLKVG